MTGSSAGTRPLVSILVPVYNRAELLVPCVESARSQEFRDLEIVIVDNASTDDTWAVCQQLAAEDPRIRAFRNPANLGPVRNWARCLAEAKGTYGKLLFSDDTIAPDFLTAVLPWLLDPSIGFAYTAARLGRTEQLAQVAYEWRQGPGRHSTRDFIAASLAGDTTVPLSPGCALFRLADLQEAIRYELPFAPPHDLSRHGAGADQLLYLLTAQRYPAFASLAIPAAFFRVHRNSITIDGLDGEVALSYVLARLWFARTFSYQTLARHQRTRLARLWLTQMRATHHWDSPASACRRYGGEIGPGRLIVDAAVAISRQTVWTLGRGVLASLRAMRGRGTRAN